MGLIELVGQGPVALDTCVFIYWIEDHQDFAPLVAPVFEAMDRQTLQGVTSGISLLETLVVPYRAGHHDLVERYEAFLTRGRGLDCRDVSRSVLKAAALLRAVHGIRTPDAIQLATALQDRCTAFVTNDRELPAMDGLAVIQLSDLC